MFLNKNLRKVIYIETIMKNQNMSFRDDVNIFDYSRITYFLNKK